MSHEIGQRISGGLLHFAKRDANSQVKATPIRKLVPFVLLPQ
jgi:hypothetical protein